MKKLFLILLALLNVAGISAIDTKYMKKTADWVWKLRPELFDAKTVIPDSISKDASAVIITDYVYVNGDIERISSLRQATSRLKRDILIRKMIKLYDQSAVDKYSDFEIGGRSKVDIPGYKVIGETKHAFGARVYKADGRVIDVDVSSALPVYDGKDEKEKNVSYYKLPIPNLEVGDVIDYFDFKNEWSDNNDLSEYSIGIFNNYPTMHYEIEERFHPDITVEYRTCNGAPEMTHGRDSKQFNTLSLVLNHIPVITDDHFLLPRRQFPFYYFATLNNEAGIESVLTRSRRPGIYANSSPGTIYRQIGEIIKYIKHPDREFSAARKYASEWIKAHPESTKSQQIDAAWVALLYTTLNSKKKMSLEIPVMFINLLDKLNLLDENSGFGFINSNKDVETRNLLQWTSMKPVAWADGRMFLEKYMLYYLPGEAPAEYHNESGAYFKGLPANVTSKDLPTEFVIPATKPAQNLIEMIVDGNLTEDGNVEAIHKFTVKGTSKSINPFGTPEEWSKEAAKYLGFEHNAKKGEKTAEAIAERDLENARDFAKDFFSKEPAEIKDVAVESFGVLPDSPDAKFSFKATHADTGSDLGDGEMMVNLGRLIKAPIQLKDNERSRQLAAFLSSPQTIRYQINLNIPEGWAVVPESLKELEVNSASFFGNFFAKPQIDENGKLSISVVERWKTYAIPSDRWNEMLEVLDALSKFSDASILLKKN